MLPLQFRHPGPPFPTFLRHAGHPQNGLKFWLVGRSQGSHMNVTLPLQFRHPGMPFPTLLRLAGYSKTALNLVGRLIGHREVTRTSCCLCSFVTLARPSRPFYALRETPKIALNFGQSVGRSVKGKSQERHAASSVLSPGTALPDPSTPCGPPSKWL
jgi:hypothetical protein